MHKVLLALVLVTSVSTVHAAKVQCRGQDSRTRKAAEAEFTLDRAGALVGDVYADSDEFALLEGDRPVARKNIRGQAYNVYEVGEDGYGGFTHLYIPVRITGKAFVLLGNKTVYSESGLVYRNSVRLNCVVR